MFKNLAFLLSLLFGPTLHAGSVGDSGIKVKDEDGAIIARQVIISPGRYLALKVTKKPDDHDFDFWVGIKRDGEVDYTSEDWHSYTGYFSPLVQAVTETITRKSESDTSTDSV